LGIAEAGFFTDRMPFVSPLRPEMAKEVTPLKKYSVLLKFLYIAGARLSIGCILPDLQSTV